MRILVVEDDRTIARNIREYLTKEGFSVDSAFDGEDGQYRAETEDYDCIVLDWMLPNISGIEVCKALRADNNSSLIILLTAKGELEDKLEGLDSGADDYLTKPFSIKELSARIRALIRRRSTTGPIPIVTIGKLQLDTNSHVVTVNNNAIELSPREYGVLEYLCLHLGSAIDRTDLLFHVWGDNADAFSNTVDVHVHNLRQKLDDPEGKLIQTVKGKGYLICQI